jgi:uncharacterized protein YdaU (DUF1376 family)
MAAVNRPVRRPPAYSEYGSDLLALEAVRLMSLAERGLLATMRWSAWANDSLPRDPKQLARVLGLAETEVAGALTERVLRFFAPCANDPERLHCPELSAQMAKLLQRREEMARLGAEGGKSSVRQRKLAQASAQASAQPHAQAKTKPTLKLAEKNREEKNRTELSREARSFHEDDADLRRAFGDPP